MIRKVAQRTGYTEYTCERVFGAAMDEITATLEGGENVSIYCFGKFEVKTRAPRMVRDFGSGQMQGIGYRRKVTFTASEKLISKKV